MRVNNKKICGLLTAIFTISAFVANPAQAAAAAAVQPQATAAVAAATQSPDLARLIAAGPAAVELTMRPGDEGFICEGLAYASPAPVWIDDSLFLPFRAIAEAFGAEITYSESSDPDFASAGNDGAGGDDARGFPEIKGVFMNNEFIFAVGADHFMLNGADVGLSEDLRIIDDTAYIRAPVFDLCLGVKTLYDAEANAITIWLEDDGGIRDLSGLLGEIRETTVGDSYYNWRIDVPIKSMLLSSSFRGDEVLIYNQLRNALIEIIVRPGRGHAPEYYVANSEEISDDFYVESAQAVGTGASAYVQAVLYGYGTVGLSRVYPRTRYDYIATVYALEDEYGYASFDAEDLMGNNPYSKILDTFIIQDFKTNGSDIKDLSKVVDGKIEYTRYLDSPDNSVLLMPWSIAAIPTWDVLYESEAIDVVTVLGDGADENLTVTVELMPAEVTADEYMDNYEALNAARFNADAYQPIDSKTGMIGDRKFLDISYMLNGNDVSYMFYERIIPSGGALYRLRLKTAKLRFEHMRITYLEMLDSFEIHTDGANKTSDYLARQDAALRKLWISDSEEPADVGGGVNIWRSMLPGDWIDTKKWDAASTLYGISGYVEPSVEAYIFVYFESYEDIDFAGAGEVARISSMEYAQSLTEEAYDNEDGFEIGNPEPARFGSNDYAGIHYSRNAEDIDYSEQFPGYPLSGDVYILAESSGIYYIYAEIPFVFDTPLNRLGFKMFLERFRVLNGYSEQRAAVSSDTVSDEDAKKTRTGAVG